MFGDGNLASCKPISEADLAAFIADCVQQRDRVNQVLPIGGKTTLQPESSSYELAFNPNLLERLSADLHADAAVASESCTGT